MEQTVVVRYKERSEKEKKVVAKPRMSWIVELERKNSNEFFRVEIYVKAYGRACGEQVVCIVGM